MRGAARLKRGSVLAAAAWTACLAGAALDSRQACAQPQRAYGSSASEASQVGVFDAARIDGYPVRTRALRYAEPAEAALSGLVRSWQAASAKVVRADAAGWRIASRLTDEGFETVQLRDVAAGSSEGFSTVWGRRAGGRPERPDWLPPDARWFRQVESRDAGQHALTTIAALPGEAHRVREAVVASMSARGWHMDPAQQARMQAAAQAAARTGRAVVLLRRGHEQMLLTIAPRPDGAALVAHTTEETP